MGFTTAITEQGQGTRMGRVVRAPSRSLEALDTREGFAPVQAVGAQLYRSADAVMDALAEARKRAAIDSAIEDARTRKIAEQAARDVAAGRPPAGGFSTTHALLILAALGAAVLLS